MWNSARAYFSYVKLDSLSLSLDISTNSLGRKQPRVISSVLQEFGILYKSNSITNSFLAYFVARTNVLSKSETRSIEIRIIDQLHEQTQERLLLYAGIIVKTTTRTNAGGSREFSRLFYGLARNKRGRKKATTRSK